MSLDLETAKALVLAEIQREGEDYIYKKDLRPANVVCTNYENDGTPSCLVGRALDTGGFITFNDVMEGSDAEGDSLVNAGIGPLNEFMGLGIEADAMDFLYTLQYLQDCGRPWGTAYELALSDPLKFGHE